MSSHKLLLIYIFSLIGIAPFLNHFFPGSQRILIWGLGTIIAVLILSKESNRLKTMPKEYLLYLSLLVFSLFSIYKIVDFNGFFRYYQVLIANSILMVIVFLGIKSYVDFKKVIEVLFICTSAIVFYSYVQESGASYGVDSYERLTGIVGNSNGTATYARTSILLGLCILNWSKSVIRQIVVIGAILIFAYVIILTASRSNFAILLFILLSYIYIKYFKKFNLLTYAAVVALIVLSIGSFVVTYLDDFYVYERLTKNEGKSFEDLQEDEARVKLYTQAFTATLENPINGLGLNQFRYYSDGHISHTDILDISSQLGLIAVFFYISIYVTLWRKFRYLYVKFQKDIIIKILFLLFFTEILFGLSNPNWFLQLNMVVLSLLITYIALYEKYEKNIIQKA